MAKELSSIIAQAAQVRDASQREENTATRVGGVLCDIVEYLAEQITAGNLRIVSDSNGTGLSVTFYNNEGQAVAQRQNIPVVSSAINGLMTPGYLAKLNTAFSQSGTNQTAIETRRLEIVELTNRLKGRSDYSNAFTDPQVHLGDFDTMEEVNDVIDGMVTSAASPETKFTGHCVVGLLGCRFDIHQYALHFATGDFIQCVTGGVLPNADKTALLAYGHYNILFRRITNFTPETWQTLDTLIPTATEGADGLLPSADKWKLNNVINLGTVSTSAVGEAAGLNANYLKADRPVLIQYYDTRNAQCGQLLSNPVSATKQAQLLFLGASIFRRDVELSNGTWRADSYGWKRTGICTQELDGDTWYLQDYEDARVCSMKLSTWLQRVSEYTDLKDRVTALENRLNG